MSSYRALTWDELLSRLLKKDPRDEKAWFEIRNRLVPYVRVALRRVGYKEPDAMDDVCDRVLIKLHSDRELLKNLACDDGVIAARPYLVTMVYNAATDFLREYTRRSGRLVALEERDAFRKSDLLVNEKWRSADELREILERLLESHEWELLRERFWEDRSIKEIASRRNIPYHAAAMRLHRLQKRLVEIMKTRRPGNE